MRARETWPVMPPQLCLRKVSAVSRRGVDAWSRGGRGRRRGSAGGGGREVGRRGWPRGWRRRGQPRAVACPGSQPHSGRRCHECTRAGLCGGRCRRSDASGRLAMREGRRRRCEVWGVHSRGKRRSRRVGRQGRRGVGPLLTSGLTSECTLGTGGGGLTAGGRCPRRRSTWRPCAVEG